MQVHLKGKKHRKVANAISNGGGFCIPCKAKCLNPKDWQTHLESAEHTAMVQGGGKCLDCSSFFFSPEAWLSHLGSEEHREKTFCDSASAHFPPLGHGGGGWGGGRNNERESPLLDPGLAVPIPPYAIYFYLPPVLGLRDFMLSTGRERE